MAINLSEEPAVPIYAARFILLETLIPMYQTRRCQILADRNLDTYRRADLKSHINTGRPSTPHDPESDAGGSLSSWQGHPSR
jgi:hypothetical protein